MRITQSYFTGNKGSKAQHAIKSPLISLRISLNKTIYHSEMIPYYYSTENLLKSSVNAEINETK